MATRPWLLLPSVLLLTACFEKSDDDDDDDGGSDSGSYTLVPADDTGDDRVDSGDGDGDGGSDGGGLAVSCRWDSESFHLEITGGDPAGYDLGFAETGACGDACWTGEDCGYVGYTTSSGTTYEYCHPMSPSGGVLAIIATFAEISPGSTTLMSGEIDLSYYLYENATGICWTWGKDNTWFFDCVDSSDVLRCSGD